MFRKNYFTLLLSLSLVFIGSLSVFAQTAPVSGKVELKKGNGTVEPVNGATVDVYRTDIKGKLPSAKTNKKGEFSFAGLPVGATFSFAISAPNASPELLPNVKAGMDKLMISMREGDGKRWTEEEVRTALSTPSTATSSNGNEPQQREMTAEEKKKQAEYEKQVADITNKNKKVEETNKLVNQALQDGAKAFGDKNYDLAIAKFDEGISADPDFAGTAPVLLNNKAKALINRATNTYNQNVKADAATKASAMETVKNDFTTAAASANRVLEILKTATSTDAAVQKNYDLNKNDALWSRKEALRLMAKTGVDRNRGKEALTAFEEYLAIEPDAKKKADSQLQLGLTLQDSNEFDNAIVAFEKVLAADPANVEALQGAGFSLVNVAYISNDKTKFQQGSNYLQKFVDVAPDTHPFKADAKGLIESLKKEQNVAPQKGGATKKKS